MTIVGHSSARGLQSEYSRRSPRR